MEAILRLAIFLILGISTAASAQQPSINCKDRGALEADLTGYAGRYAASRGYHFGQGAEGLIANAMQQAANQLSQLSQVQCQQGILEARRNIHRYVDAMIANARADASYSKQNPGVIGEQTFAAARRLCPIWPFC